MAVSYSNVIAEMKPLWATQTKNLDVGDEVLFKLLKYFLVLTPAESRSARTCSLDDYYHFGANPFGNQSFRKEIDRILEYKIEPCPLSAFSNAIKKNGLEGDFYTNPPKPVVVFVASKSEYKLLFDHIRNSLAHGRFSIVTNSEGVQFVVMENGRSTTVEIEKEKVRQFRVNARIVLKVDSMLNLVSYLESQRALYYSVFEAISKSEYKKSKYIECTGADEAQVNKVIQLLKNEHRISFVAGKWKKEN